MSPEQLARAHAADLRKAEVAREKKERYKRSKHAPSRYKSKPGNVADRQCNAARKQIRTGEIPKPTQELRHGELTEYIWLWQGERALQTAQDFLMFLSDKLPPDSKCYLAVGNGFTKDSRWLGTRMDTPANVWFHSQTFLSSQSDNAKLIESKVKSADYNQKLDLWAEVKLLTKGRVEL